MSDLLRGASSTDAHRLEALPAPLLPRAGTLVRAQRIGTRMTSGPLGGSTGPSEPDGALRVAVEVHPSAGSVPSLSVMTLAGDLDLYAVPRMRRATEDALPARAATTISVTTTRDVVVDVAAVGFVDSAGLGALLGLLRRTTALGGRLALVGASEQVRRLLTMTGVTSVVSLHATLGEAVAARSATA